ncbi:MAG TPA: hypothetical protein VNO81_12505, partial [Candidatus Nitrosotenuis sp.]|nr:hypothetical protein [Candidatus Nitrosotenuis sp.]
MALVRLAPQTVALLNALWGACRGIRPGRWPALDEALPGYRAQLQRVRAWLDFQSAYSLDEQEEALLGNLQFLLDELEQMAAEPPADPCQWARAACEKEMAFAGLAERLVARRQEPHFSSHPAFNELLTAGAALFLGRAQPRAVRSASSQGTRKARRRAVLQKARRGERTSSPRAAATSGQGRRRNS